MKPGNQLNSTMALAALAVAASLSWVTTASASSPVTVLNAGFELPVMTNGSSSTSAPTSWSLYVGGSVGVWNVQTADYPAEAPEGSNIGYVFGAGAGNGLSQVLTTNFQADSNYSLSVKVGQSLTYPTSGYTVQLVAGGVVLTNGQDDNTNSPAAGSFVTSTINYIYNAADSALVGQPLEIRLLSKGLNLSGEIDFDDVQLTVTLGSPVAKPGGPYNVTAVGSLSLNGSASLPSDGQTLTTYEWDLNNDGNYGELITGATPASISYATLTSTHGMGPGANTIRLRVTDDSSPTPKTNVATATVNLPPGPPANDNFANAIDLTGAGAGQTGNVTSGTQTGTYSTSATPEVGEPALGSGGTKTVWFKWTSPGDGAFTYGTLGSTTATPTEWDSVVGIYSGAALNALTPVGATPRDTGLAETMTVTVTPGTTYYIQLAGFNGEDATNILLNWNYVATVYQAEILTYGPGAVISPVVANAANISWTVPFGSNLATLTPTFTLFIGATCTLDGNPAVSGATVDFSGGPKNYIVTSQGGAFVNTYTVTIIIGPPPFDGTWTADAAGNWSDTTKWAGGTVAIGPDKTAFFTAPITAARTVTLDTNRTIGNITFTDSTTSSHDLTIASTPTTNTLTLDVSSGAPVVDVTQTLRHLFISSPITGNDGLTKNGIGWLHFSNATSNFTGNTTVNAGILDFGGIPNANIGGGTGRNITATTTGVTVRFNALSNAFLNRLVETSNEICIMTGTTANSFDLSSSTGANLPNAFIANFATNGAKCELSGTITPGGGAYRLGYSNQSGALGITQTNLLSGSNQLIVGGNRVVVVGAHTFTGDTTIRDGGRLGLAAFTGGTNSLGLQNSPLNIGTPASTGTLFLESGSVAGPITGSNLSSPAGLAQGTVSATLGGLKGSRNLASVIAVGNTGNNTSGTALPFITGFTLNPGTAVSCTYSGIIADFAKGVSLVMAKTGDGTQEFSGSNSYTGTTTISSGTLKISHANALAFGGMVTTSTGASTVNSGATLDLNGSSGINEPIVLNGDGVGANGAMVNNSGSPAGVSNGIAALTLPVTGSGSAYTTTVPTVTISSGGGSGATATAFLGLTTASVTSVSGGAGWAVGDTMRINNASGNGAIAQVTSVSSGAVTGLSIIRSGAGFTGVASMVISRLASAATTNPTITWNATNFTVGALQITNGGSGYTSAPTVTFSAGNASNSDVTKTLSSVVLASDSRIGGTGNSSLNAVVSESGGARALTKVGAGTLALTGANDYTGATSVNEGTLALVGGSQKSPITVATSASLGFTLGSPTTSTAALDMTNGTVKITGTVDNGSDYKLMTASSINVTPALATPISNYELQRLAGNTELWLVYVGSDSYARWQYVNSTAQTKDLDHDGDGVKNGVEYFLGGAANTTGFTALPGVVNTAGTLSITWPKGAGYVGVYGTDYVVETSTTLGGVWTTETLGGGNITDSGLSVKYTFPAPLVGGKFARLKVTGP